MDNGRPIHAEAFAEFGILRQVLQENRFYRRLDMRDTFQKSARGNDRLQIALLRAGRQRLVRCRVVQVHRHFPHQHRRQIHQRARKVYWLNPEKRAEWNGTDSVMDIYAPHCDAVFEVRNLRQLAAFVAELT